MTDPASLPLESRPEARPAPTPVAGQGGWRPNAWWFAAEIAVVVVGVLIALALNAWWGGREDAAREADYLALISRDLGHMIDDLENLLAFESTQVEDGFAVYRAISGEDRSPEARALISDVLTNLTLRRTMRLTNPAYKDLLSTGNLDLIRNRSLRDDLVAFYERTEREFEIHNLNNASYVDDLYKDALFRDGLFVFRGPARSTEADTNEADSLLLAETRGGYADVPDPIWSLPFDAPEWQMVRGQLLSRVRISLYGRLRARNILAETHEMRAAIEAERSR